MKVKREERYVLEKDVYKEFVVFQENKLQSMLYGMEVIFDKKWIKEFLVSEIKKSSKTEQQIISLYYVEKLNIGEISECMNITESKVIGVIQKVVSSFKYNSINHFNYKVNIKEDKASENNDWNRLDKLNNLEMLMKDLNSRIYDERISEFSVLVFEIKNLSHINRDLSYGYGQSVIIQTVKSVNKMFKNCNLYLINTNEIVIISNDLSLMEVYKKGKNLLKEFSDFVVINGIPVDVKVNCGIVSYPEDGKDSKILFQNMGRVLSQCGNYNGIISLYNEELSEKMKEYYQTKTKVVNAINNEELRLVYQPKYNIVSNEVIGSEALLRVDSSELSISDVINIAEQTNLINHLSKWVVKEAVEQLEQWKLEGVTTKVSINVSPKDLANEFFLEYLIECVDKSCIQPNMIEIEITERCVIENNETINDLLRKFMDYGFEISIDDYGTGHNSLKNVLVYHFNYLKIDKYFIDNLENKGAYSLVEGIIKTAKELNIGVIAEGVETQTQYLILESLGCDIIQGYFFSKPLRPDDLKRILKS